MDVAVAMTALTNSRTRIGYFDGSLRAQAERLTASRHTRLPTLVCSEKLGPELREQFELVADAHRVDLQYHPGPAEIGANHNFLLENVSADYTMFIEDDFHLERPLDLSDDIDFLEANPDFVMVRYFVGNESSIDPLGELSPGMWEVGKLSNYPYSNTPHLRHRERFATLGPHLVGGGWGAQEHHMGRMLRDSPLRIAVRRPDYFSHWGRIASQPERWPEGETP
jgi:hypothetical protein